MDKTLEKIQTYLIWLIILILPVGVLSSFLDPLGLPKLLILIVGVGAILIIKAIQVIRNGRLDINIGTFDLPVAIFVIVYLIASLVRTPNKMDAFFSPGITSLVIAGGILYFLINQQKAKERKNLLYVLLASGVILGIVTIFGFLGIFSKLPQIPSFFSNPQFNVSGDFLTSAVILGVLVPLALYALITLQKLPEKILVGFCLVIITLGLSLSIFNILPGKPTSPVVPDINTTWVITLEAIKENPLVGVGPANYISAFNRFRPVSYNQTPLWPYRFTSGRNFYLTTVTETGLAGLISLGVFVYFLFKFLKASFANHEKFKLSERAVFILSLSIILITLAFFPASFLMIVFLFILLALNTDTKVASLNLTTRSADSVKEAKFPAIVLGLLVIAGVVFLGIKIQPTIAAEATFKNAFDALNRNDGKATYDLLRSAITNNPLVDRYHASYAQVNLAIARSIMSQNQTGKELSEDQKNTINQLISQAVREGQATVSLNNERAGNWQVLASIYQAIMPMAKDADQFAIQSYTQTINLDPINPNLRITLGGIYYSLGQWDNAIQVFQLAALTKPDFANTHYNLAAAYRENNQIDKAIVEMQTVLQLVPKDSQDYKLAQTELEALQKKQPSKGTAGQGGESLTAPQKTGAPTINPPLTLPQEATPPAAPQIPGATPSPTPTPKP